MAFDDINTIIFDFDGTLATCPYDFTHMRLSILETAEAFGLAREELLGFGLLEAVAEGARLLADSGRAEAFRVLAMERLGAIEYEAAAKTRLLPGILDALAGMHARGYLMGVVTRNSSAAVRLILGEVRLPVEVILCREDVPHPKPHIDHVHQVLQHLDARPEHALMVGDHPTDIQMGKDAGMATVAVLTGQTGEADLRAAAPDLLLPSVLVLAELLTEKNS
ncbi:MAG: HAD family hydrolase [Armatimonadota bacterium]